MTRANRLFHTDNLDKRERHSIYSELEGSDRACTHIVIIIGAVFAVLAYILYPGGIFDIDLTPGIVIRLIGAVLSGILAILIFIDVVAIFIKRQRD